MEWNWSRIIVVAAVCAVPLALVAQTAPNESDPAALPVPEAKADDPAAVDDAGRDARGDGERRRDGQDPRVGGRMEDGSGGGDGFRPPIDSPDREEWARFEAFVRENSPRRWAVVENHPDPDRQQMTRMSLFQRFRMLERLRNADHDMYQVNLKRFAVEDEIFELGAPALGPAGRSLTPEETSKLREKVSELVDIGLEEREVRVQRLREMLKREEELFATERAQREEIIADRIARIERGRLLTGSGTMGPIGPRAPDRGRFGGRPDSTPPAP